MLSTVQGGRDPSTDRTDIEILVLIDWNSSGGRHMVNKCGN